MTGQCTGLCENAEVACCFTSDPAWQDAWVDYLTHTRNDETRDQAYQRRIAAREQLCAIETAYGCYERKADTA